MAYDVIFIWKICQNCHRFAFIDQHNWYIMPNSGQLCVAVKQLSKKCLCIDCINKLMLEAITKGDDNNVSVD